MGSQYGGFLKNLDEIIVFPDEKVSWVCFSVDLIGEICYYNGVILAKDN